MQKKPNLKSFNLYEFLKHQNAHSFNVPFFLADQDTYKNAHVNFPFRTFTYGPGITYSGDGDVCKIGSADYLIKAGSLTTVGPGLVCNWTGNYTAKHGTVYFTEELLDGLQTNSLLQSLSFFSHGGNHVIQLTDEQRKKDNILIKFTQRAERWQNSRPGYFTKGKPGNSCNFRSQEQVIHKEREV